MTVPASPAFLAGHSEMARLLREKDWSTSPLGQPASWPQPLRSVVSLMLGSPFPMFVVWGPGLHTLYNDSYAEIMGDKHPRGVGGYFLDIWHEIQSDLEPLIARVLGGEPFFMENLPLRMRRHGFDEDTWFTFSYSPVTDEAGHIAGFYCACTETTRMVRAERRLLAREDWLQSLFDQSPGFAAVVRGRSHVIERANQACHTITGHRPLEGLAVSLALPELVGQGLVVWLDRVYRSGKPFVGRSVPAALHRGPGQAPQEVFLDFMLQPLRDATGQVQGIFMQGHDVSAQHHAQLALREADQQKDDFLATLAHELRNPLAPIRTAVHLLGSPRATEDSRAQATRVIERQVMHVTRLLDDLIDIARITKQRLALKKEVVEVATVVDAAMEAARPLADAKGHRLVAQVDDPGVRLLVDPVRITQVLSNLLNNASKYTDPGGTIVLAVCCDGPRLRFDITDNGIGLGGDALSKLFVMFSQEKSALDRSEGGLGIGLALVKGLVEMHGGTVSAASEGLGRGSRFVVELPVSEGTAPCEPPAAPAPECQPEQRLRVLLADDNRDAVDMLAALLRMGGHEVMTAYEGEGAAAMAARHRPDVMVLDIGMPGLNGYEVARQVRAQAWDRQPLLVAATGWGQQDDQRRAMAAGFDVHLTKPFDPQALSDLLAAHAAVPAAALSAS
ncbi:MAG: response regulator [Hydrogenophaga sp.]|nr:response regulator [Hydrogenophaga sp.]